MRGRIMPWAVLTALLIAPRVQAEPATETVTRPFLWEIKAPEATAYLLGSLHVGRADLLPLPRAAYSAFDASEHLVVEANPFAIDEQAMARKMMVKALRLDGDSYRSVLKPELYGELTQVARRHNLTPSYLDRLKPWYVAQLLAMLEMKRLGIEPENGIDRHLIMRAGDDKPILELEGVDKQLEFLDSFSDDEQLLMLEYTLRDLENLEENMEDITSAWKAGDAAGLDKLLTGYLDESPGLDAVFERLFTQRDQEMAERMEELLKKGGSYFVVVGAGHLVADDGIIKRLESKGYSVKQAE